MTISRRGFIAGLAVAGAAAPAAYYAHKQLTHDPEDDIVTPGEASVELADSAGQQLADQLRGIWDLRFHGSQAGLDGLPDQGLQLYLDVATKGRGLLSNQGGTDYECIARLDEVWGSFGNAGSGTLSGRLQPLDRSMALPLQDNHFVAVKRLFPEARERLPYTPQLQAWLISAEHRLFHQLWHATRDKWLRLSEDKRSALRGLGWQPGPRDPADFASRWFGADNDFLGDPFSSHVHPVFWGFHGWIDDRIEDWYRVHERHNPGQVRRRQVNGVQWFVPGRWVEVGDPWLGPDTHGCSTVPGAFAGKSVVRDVETMKLALRITFGEGDKIGDLIRRVPQRPWYARHLSLRGIVA